jgi:ATP-dependent helicase/nuclease subunit A
LELLPDFPAASRMAAAEAFLDQALKPEFESRRKDTLLRSLRILEKPEFQPVFSAR